MGVSSDKDKENDTGHTAAIGLTASITSLITSTALPHVFIALRASPARQSATPDISVWQFAVTVIIKKPQVQPTMSWICSRMRISASGDGEDVVVGDMGGTSLRIEDVVKGREGEGKVNLDQNWQAWDRCVKEWSGEIIVTYNMRMAKIKVLKNMPILRILLVQKKTLQWWNVQGTRMMGDCDQDSDNKGGCDGKREYWNIWWEVRLAPAPCLNEHVDVTVW
jgi:hypothetical protein